MISVDRDGPASVKVIRTLLQQSKQVIPDSDWEVHYDAFFAREGFTEAARNELTGNKAAFVDLERLDADLQTAGEP